MPALTPADVPEVVRLLSHELLGHNIGVHEVWWETNARYPGLPMSERMAVAEHIVRRLLLLPGVNLIVESDPKSPVGECARPPAVLRDWATWVVGDDHPIVWLTRTHDCISLDASLRAASSAAPDLAWSVDAAVDLARSIGTSTGLQVEYEPPDEEWVRMNTDSEVGGMISARLPLLLGKPLVVAASVEQDDRVFTLTIHGYDINDLIADPELLTTTVLPYGLDRDLDPSAFSAQDIFVGSI